MKNRVSEHFKRLGHARAAQIFRAMADQARREGDLAEAEALAGRAMEQDTLASAPPSQPEAKNAATGSGATSKAVPGGKS